MVTTGWRPDIHLSLHMEIKSSHLHLKNYRGHSLTHRMLTVVRSACTFFLIPVAIGNNNLTVCNSCYLFFLKRFRQFNARLCLPTLKRATKTSSCSALFCESVAVVESNVFHWPNICDWLKGKQAKQRIYILH